MVTQLVTVNGNRISLTQGLIPRSWSRRHLFRCTSDRSQ